MSFTFAFAFSIEAHQTLHHVFTIPIHFTIHAPTAPCIYAASLVSTFAWKRNPSDPTTIRLRQLCVGSVAGALGPVPHDQILRLSRKQLQNKVLCVCVCVCVCVSVCERAREGEGKVEIL